MITHDDDPFICSHFGEPCPYAGQECEERCYLEKIEREAPAHRPKPPPKSDYQVPDEELPF